MMGFLSPLFLVGLLAAAIPVAIHLFHRRPDPVIEFAAIRYLRRAPIEQPQRRRLRELLLLALRVTALTLLALAFARPYFQTAAGGGASATVVLIDTSASLSAPNQFERARARAHDAIRSAAAADSMAVAAFASGVDVVAPLSLDRAAAHAAVAALQPGAGATRYRVALARGAGLLEGRPGRLVVVSDLQASGWEAGDARAVPRGVEVAVADVGAPDRNLSVMSLRTDGADAIAVVHNFSSEAASEQVAFTIDGRPAGVVLVAVPPHGAAEARLAVPDRRDGVPPRALSASVADRFGYTADDTRYAVLDPAAAPAVLAVTASADPSEAFFLERALTVGAGARAFRFTLRSGSSFSDLTAEALAEYDAIAILGTRGISRPARERLAAYVRSGGGLLLVAGPDVDAPADVLENVVGTRWKARSGERLTGGDARLALAPDDSRHPVFRPFAGAATLGNVTFREAVDVTAPAAAAIVARYSDGTPALVEEQVGDGRVLVFASDLNDRWNDFPLQPVFVPFVHETLRYLSAPRSVRTEYLVGEVAGPAGLSPGVVTRGGRPVAVNVDPRESDPSRMTVDEFMAGVSGSDAARALRETGSNATAARAADSDERADQDRQRLWQAALLLMVLSLAAEGVVGRRLV
jgi:hypothetical protein